MADITAWLVLGTVLLLLALSAWQQARARPLHRRLDALGLVPQWKFFGQADVGPEQGALDDWHVVARLASVEPGTSPGPWQPVLWPPARPLLAALWNPAARRHGHLLDMAHLLTRAEPQHAAQPTALIYLAVLRACFAVLSPPEPVALQFAIAVTRGRGERLLAIGFVSAWHRR